MCDNRNDVTIAEIQNALEPIKPMTRQTVYSWLHRLGIKPAGEFDTKPQLYPDDTAKRIACAVTGKQITTSQLLHPSRGRAIRLKRKVAA